MTPSMVCYFLWYSGSKAGFFGNVSFGVAYLPAVVSMSFGRMIALRRT